MDVIVDVDSAKQEKKTNIISAYNLFIYIFIFILLIVVTYVLYTIINPTVPIKYIKSYFHIVGDADLIDDATEIESFTATIALDNKKPRTFTCNIYHLRKLANRTGVLIIDLPGGAFLNSSNTFIQYKHIENLDIDVVSIEYPVLPYGNAARSIAFIEKAIQYIITKYCKKWNTETIDIYMNTASAGSYYGVKIINNGNFSKYIKKFSSVSGYFGYKTINDAITTIGDKMYLRQLENSTLLDCAPISESAVSTFYATTLSDPLNISTIKYLSQTGQVNEIMNYNSPGHCFYLLYNDEATKQYYTDLYEFFKN